jgi:drug/metabolite transporter (DMT)-like permease
MSKRPFVVMGLLDCITGTLLTFAAVYLPGSLLILLPQAAIPISMMLSHRIKGERYSMHQYLGAAVVVLGIFAVLEPLVTRRHDADFVCVAYDMNEYCALCGEEMTEAGCASHRVDGVGKNGVTYDAGSGPGRRGDGLTSIAGDDIVALMRSLVGSDNNSSSPSMPYSDHDGELCQWMPSDSAEMPSSGTSTTTLLIWSAMTILACIPMTLSSIYKEMKLNGVGSRDGGSIDPIFLNGWVAVFQLLFSIVLSVPAGMTSNPPVTPRDLPSNIVDGIKCYFGIASIASGCHPDDQCHEAPLYVNVFLAFNICFNILIVYILK